MFDRYVVDVRFSTHDGLKDGIVEMDWHRVIILAFDGNDAEQYASLMLICRGWYVTGAQCIDWPD